jgi:predicted O-methyltransferase YrrM
MAGRGLLRNVKRRLMPYPVFPVINLPFRVFDTWRHYIGPIVKNWLVWIFSSRADANFTYDLTERCRINIAAGLSGILRKDYNEILGYFDEIESDDEFNSHVGSLWHVHPERYRTDTDPHVGRRMVWYAVARAIKPKVLVETGVDQGLGAVVLCAALRRNKLEGYEGKYYGTDINPAAGYYLQGEYRKFGEVIIGDSLKSLEVLDEKIDLFINDSDHSADYEQAEYEMVKPKLADGAILLGDNSHVTPRLAEFSMRNGRKFVFLSEEPANHWYRGAGVGVSFPS